MSFTPLALLEELTRLAAAAAPPQRYVVALSGGLDSMVLMHALSDLQRCGEISVPVQAVHVDHGLRPESAEWSRFCTATAATLGIAFQSLKVNVALSTGKGPEAAARDARYTALRSTLQPGDWLLSAHHREDQAETLLLNLVRGSGPLGIAGIAGIREFPPGWLARPMLNAGKASIERYADDLGLDWIDDPSNTEQRFDRNFLRHDVLPTMRARWPDIATRLQRSAGHAREAAGLLAELAALDFGRIGQCSERLPIDQLTQLSPARQRNVIRFALREQRLAAPTTRQLDTVMTELVPAREDAQPVVSWPGASVRRYRNGLYLLPEKLASALQGCSFDGQKLDLGPGLGTLRLQQGAGNGLSETLVEAGLSVGSRVGGEEFRPHGQAHTRKLKKLLQEEGIVPWMRYRLPLVYAGEQLIAVGDLWLAADATAEPGVALLWDERPALH